jgi:hypothetical protein
VEELMKRIICKSNKKYIFILVFAIVLTSAVLYGRIYHSHNLKPEKHFYAKNGQIDIRNWNIRNIRRFKIIINVIT